MTGWQVLGMVLIPLALVVMAMANEKHREEHGVNAPSRKAMARIRRNARKRGVSTSDAYETWLHHKQRQAGVGASAPADPAGGSLDDRPHATMPTHPALPPREPSTIREWRRASGLSVREIAVRLEMPEHVVDQLVNGTRKGDAETVERLIALMRETRDALPMPLPFDGTALQAAAVVYQTTTLRAGAGKYVAGHFRKDGTWVKPHWRKPRGYR